MPMPVIVYDIETIPDISGISRAFGLHVGDATSAESFFGDKFPPAPFHKIVAIAMLTATYEGDGSWRVREISAPHAGEMTEKEIIEKFMATVDQTMPILVSYNGASFDLPVILWRAALHKVAGLHLSRFSKSFPRSRDHHWDLCDLLSGFEAKNRVKLDVACKFLGVEGKSGGVDGSQVAELAQRGEFSAIADYCTGDIAALHRIFLRREVVNNRLSDQGLQDSLDSLEQALRQRRAGRGNPAP